MSSPKEALSLPHDLCDIRKMHCANAVCELDLQDRVMYKYISVLLLAASVLGQGDIDQGVLNQIFGPPPGGQTGQDTQGQFNSGLNGQNGQNGQSGQNGGNPNFVDIFGPPPSSPSPIPTRPPVTSTTSATFLQPEGNNGAGENEPCQTPEGTSGTCVPYYLCNTENNTIISDGTGIIDIRIKDGPCQSYLDTCCLLPDTRPADNPITPTPAPEEVERKGCGWRNANGVGFRITGNKDNEAEFAEFPWMVAILRIEPINEAEPEGSKLNVYVGGGSLIHPSVVLTAAHYVNRDWQTKSIRARAGEWDTQTKQELYPNQDRDVVDVKIHRDFNKGSWGSQHSLMASHYVNRDWQTKSIRARAGEWDTQTKQELYPNQDRDVVDVKIHRDFNKAHYVNRDWHTKSIRARAGEWDTQTKQELYPNQDRDVVDVKIHRDFNKAHYVNRDWQTKSIRARAGEWDTQTKQELYPNQDRDVVDVKIHRDFNKDHSSYSYLMIAHYVNRDWQTKSTRVRVGEWDTQTKQELYPNQDRDVVDVKIHRDFNKAHYVNRDWQTKSIRARAGEWDTQTKQELYPNQDRDVVDVKIHRDFNKGQTTLGIVTHYVNRDWQTKSIRARAGEWDTQTKQELYPNQDRDVVDVKIHRDFNKGL
ncbi:unnamed protein product [Plutella xylostella]|uniref:(diamondback moth) hypothetical protein n=1 Tax=Plutella xylostella TaxID=51655 RepID=A0A8S4DXL8_PLUXY|nr:unnamed protein product [Plutella xylostella]